MGMTLPAELTEPLGWIGLTWPQADEELLFQAGSTWLTFAGTLQQARTTSDAAAEDVWTSNTGDTVEAFRAWWNGEESGPAPRLRDDAEAALIIGAALIMFAAMTLVLKIMFFVQLIILLYQVITAIGAAFATFGASTAAVPGFIALTRQICLRLIKQVVKHVDDVLKKLLKRAKDLIKRVKDRNALRGELGRVNPFRRRDLAYRTNCTHCVQAWELRRRGFDVEATALPSNLRGGRGLDVIERPWGRNFTNASPQDITRAFENFGPGSRGVVGINWNRGGAHVFSVENIDGKVHFLDSQMKKVDVSKYLGQGFNTKFVRLDDLPTPPNLPGIVKPSGT